MAMPELFAFDPTLPTKQIAALYQSKNRIHVPGILENASAALIFDHLKQRGDWHHVFNTGDKVFDVEASTMANMATEERKALESTILSSATEGFQYRYDAIRVSDDVSDRAARASVLDQFADFLSTPEALTWFRTVTGFENINFADAQATAYNGGDFLTGHDDAVSGKDRLAAFVFNFTPQWRAEWGGLLMFHNEDGHIDEAFVPCWNAVNIFTVPQMHSVSWVVPNAPMPRLSITGWLRANRP
jgi:SM-20-related protein